MYMLVCVCETVYERVGVARVCVCVSVTTLVSVEKPLEVRSWVREYLKQAVRQVWFFFFEDENEDSDSSTQKKKRGKEDVETL